MLEICKTLSVNSHGDPTIDHLPREKNAVLTNEVMCWYPQPLSCPWCRRFLVRRHLLMAQRTRTVVLGQPRCDAFPMKHVVAWQRGDLVVVLKSCEANRAITARELDGLCDRQLVHTLCVHSRLFDCIIEAKQQVVVFRCDVAVEKVQDFC